MSSVSSEDCISSPRSNRFRKSYSMKKKLEVVDWYLHNGEVVSKTAKHFGVDRKRVREWVKAETEMRNAAPEDMGRKRWHSGGEVKSVEIEVGVLDFLLEERADGLTVSNQMLKDKALEIAKNVPGMEGFKASNGWLHRWKKRNYIGIRRGTNDAQKVPADYGMKIAVWRDTIRRLRKKHDYTLHNMGNMDQTMVR